MSTSVFSTIRKSFVVKVFTPILIVFSLTGCLTRKEHYKSFLDLRGESASNYSQQVLDAIVGVREHVKIPLFFSVEAGSSTWAPTVSGATGSVLLAYNSLSTTARNLWPSRTYSASSPSATGQVSVSSSIQFNDFGSAAMSRVDSLYTFLCMPFQFGEILLPNGTLYVVSEESSSPEGFILFSKIEEGRYLGVTKEKSGEFLKFASDATYWTRHQDPDQKDLQSEAGLLYRFSLEFPKMSQTLINAINDKKRIQIQVTNTQQSLSNKLKEYESLKKEAKTAKSEPEIMNVLLQFEQKELELKAKEYANAQVQLKKVKKTIKTSSIDLEYLLNSLEITLQNVKKYDPDIDKAKVVDVTKLIDEIMDSLLIGDEKVVQELRTLLPTAGGINADESHDDLYRERFERLPQRFDETFQSSD